MTSSIFSVALPLVVALVMFGLGLGLTVADFARVAASPRAVIVTLLCQTVLLPAVCFGLVLALHLAPMTALGMMLLAASPGGPMSTVFSHLAGGDVALNVTVTGVNAILALVTMPAITLFAVAMFHPGSAAIVVPPDRVAQVFAVLLIPVVIGMAVRRWASDLAVRMQRSVRIAAIVAVTVAITVAVGQQFDHFLVGLARLGFAVTAFSVLSLGIGYLVPRLVRVGHPRAVAAGLEIGIHNSVVAITVAVSVLGIPAASYAPAMYGALMFVPASVFAWLAHRRGRVETVGRESELQVPATR